MATTLSLPAQKRRLEAHIRYAQQRLALGQVEPYNTLIQQELEDLQQDLWDVEWALTEGLWE